MARGRVIEKAMGDLGRGGKYGHCGGPCDQTIGRWWLLCVHECILVYMTCEHLRTLEQAILARGIRETFRGAAWSRNCREWVYFDCYIDIEATRSRFALADCVHVHQHRGTHDGQERGFVCLQCHDGIMGRYAPEAGMPVFRG